MDRVYRDRETLIVTRENNQNIVLMSVDEYNSLLETSLLLSSQANATHLTESLRDARQGTATERRLIDE
jgi:antitoxin YefM